MDAKKYDRQIELVDMGEAEELAVKMVMQEGALRFQDLVVAELKKREMLDAITVVEAVDVEF
jgi:hypothetical protein